jgi:hypothetical protein
VQGLGRFFEQREVVQMTGTDDAPISVDERGRATLRATKRIQTHQPRNTHASADAESTRKMSPAGLEPTTYGLKVRCSTD